jgi:ferrous iron transport protein B
MSVSAEVAVQPLTVSASEPPTGRVVALAGNPNCGKSTLFNALTGLRQRVGNYPGVTVERKLGRTRGSHGEMLELLDLPGAYSLQTRSLDEAVARDALLGRYDDLAAPDVIVCVVDATNLERNLYLAAHLAELGIPLVVALTMVDLAERDGLRVDAPALAAALGCPVVPVVATQRRGLVELRQALTRQLNGPAPHRAPLPSSLDEATASLAPILVQEEGINERFAQAEALLLLSAADDANDASLSLYARRVVAEARLHVERAGLDRVSAAVDARYAWVQEIARTALGGGEGTTGAFSHRLDAYLTHRLWGWLFFLGVMGLMFVSIFTLAETPMGWIERAQQALQTAVKGALPAGDFRDLLADGIISGVGGVVLFLPQILILFFFIGLLEDTGYMARAVFIIDRVMSRVGLSGRSFVPMLSSFACAIPGIMATRTIDNRKDRLVTILVAPLVSCSARLPVYSLMIAVLLPVGYGAWHRAGLMLGLYLLGLAAAFSMAWLFRATLFRGERSLLLMEMPPYRRPSLRVTLLRMWERSVLFLRRAGTVILAISILIWALSTYPKPSDSDATPADALASSAAGRMGRAVAPLIAPLGYDWKIGVGIISSFAAREVFVGTMAVLYSIEGGGGGARGLREAMLAERRPDGTAVYTPVTALGLMVFYVLAMQCLSTVAVVRRETNSWRWPLLQVAYMTVLAWAGAAFVFNVGRWLGYA